MPQRIHNEDNHMVLVIFIKTPTLQWCKVERKRSLCYSFLRYHYSLLSKFTNPLFFSIKVDKWVITGFFYILTSPYVPKDRKTFRGNKISTQLHFLFFRNLVDFYDVIMFGKPLLLWRQTFSNTWTFFSSFDQ